MPKAKTMVPNGPGVGASSNGPTAIKRKPRIIWKTRKGWLWIRTWMKAGRFTTSQRLGASCGSDKAVSYISASIFYLSRRITNYSGQTPA